MFVFRLTIDNIRNRQVLDKFLKNWHSSYIPETKFIYSNIGFSLLGMILSKYSNTKQLSDLYKKDIFDPLLMKTATTNFNNKLSSEGYDTKGIKTKQHSQKGLLGGSWAIKDSIKDMAMYLKACIHPNKAMQLTQTGYFETENRYQLALGWLLIPADNIGLEI